MTLPGFPSHIVLWPWQVTPGIEESKVFTFLDANGDDYDPGVVTAKAKDGTISATVTGTGNTRTVTWSAEQTDLIPATHWRLNFGGGDQLGGHVGIAQPEADADLTGEWTIQLPAAGDGLTVTVTGTPNTQALYTIPWTAQWNGPSLVPGIYAAGRVFMLGCAVDDIVPVPPSVSPTLSGRLLVHVHAAFGDDTPADPEVEDIPADTAWFTVQDREEADIYGALLIPLDYLVAPYEEYLPAPFEGAYPFGEPIWYRGTSTDGDGFSTAVHMFMPEGIPADPEAFPMVVFADGNRFEFTVAAPASDTAAGAASDVTVAYRATGPGIAAAAVNVTARLAALEARIAALEP